MGVEGSVMIRITPTPNQIKEAERIANGVVCYKEASPGVTEILLEL